MTKLYALLFLLTLQAHAQPDKALTKKLDALFAPYQPTTPGVEVLVARKGQIVYHKAFGSADLELNTPIKPDMVFKMASITKQFTAVAILQLVEQGKLSLQDSLQQYVKSFPSKGHTITIENLLTHTSGIHDYMQIDYPEPYMERRDYTTQVLIDSFKVLPLDFEPGTQFRYSNSGYFLLGYIIEQITGQRYQDYVKDHLLTPLGLNHSYFDSSNIIIPNRVNGYEKEGSGFRNADFWSMTLTYSAGGLISNVEDLFKWHQGLLTYKILKKESLDKARTSYKLKDGSETGYGYGWFLKNTNGIASIEHEGGLNGFNTNEAWYPAEDVFIALLFNFGGAPVNGMSIDVAALALGKSLQPSIQIPITTLDRYVGVYALQPEGTRTMELIREKDQLVAKVSENEKYPLVFQSETKFQFKSMTGIACEFILENGKVTQFNVQQNGSYVWKKK